MPGVPVLLVIDTSRPEAGVALRAGEGTPAWLRLQPSGRLSEHLGPAIHFLAEREQIDLAEVGGIAVVRGPGSFTGLRVGLAWALGFSQARNLPALGIDTLEALAAGVSPDSPMRVAAMLPTGSRRQDVYVAIFDLRPNDLPQRRQPTRVALPAELEATLPGCTGTVGDREIGRLPRLAGSELVLEGALRLAERRLPDLADPGTLQPSYLLEPEPVRLARSRSTDSSELTP